MRRFSFPIAVVLVLASAIAFAAPDRRIAQFEPLGASTISGDAAVNPMKDGSQRVQGHLSNLAPSTEYQVVISADNTCGGTSAVVIATFTANPAGKANFNELVVPGTTIESISVQLSGDATVLACADL
jgi:hypothetical protein